MNAVMNRKTEVRVLHAKQATPAALAPYGTILGYHPDIKPMPIEFYDGSNILAMYSQVPAKSAAEATVESCESEKPNTERQFRTLVNIMDGKRPSVQIVDFNGDGHFKLGSDGGVSRRQVSEGAHSQMSKNKERMLDIDAKSNTEELARMPEQSLRPTWRQVR